MDSINMELRNTARNGKHYELRSTNTGNLDITDRTGGATRYSIDVNGTHRFTGTINANACSINGGSG